MEDEVTDDSAQSLPPKTDELTLALEQNLVLGTSLLGRSLGIIHASEDLSSNLAFWFQANQAATLGIGIAGILIGISFAVHATKLLREKPQEERVAWDYFKVASMYAMSLTLIVGSLLMSGSPVQIAFSLIASTIKLGIAIGDFARAFNTYQNPMATPAEHLKAKEDMAKFAAEMVIAACVITLSLSVLAFPPASMVLAALLLTFLAVSITWSLMGKYTPDLQNKIKDVFGFKKQDIKMDNELGIELGNISKPTALSKQSTEVIIKPLVAESSSPSTKWSVIAKGSAGLQSKIKAALGFKKAEVTREPEFDNEIITTPSPPLLTEEGSGLAVKIDAPVQSGSSMKILGLLGGPGKIPQPDCNNEERERLAETMPSTHYEEKTKSVDVETEALPPSVFEEEKLGSPSSMRL